MAWQRTSARTAWLTLTPNPILVVCLELALFRDVLSMSPQPHGPELCSSLGVEGVGSVWLQLCVLGLCVHFYLRKESTAWGDWDTLILIQSLVPPECVLVRSDSDQDPMCHHSPETFRVETMLNISPAAHPVLPAAATNSNHDGTWAHFFACHAPWAAGNTKSPIWPGYLLRPPRTALGLI